MNKIILVGRLTRDPEIRYSEQNNTAVARYTLAVDRPFKRDGEPEAGVDVADVGSPFPTNYLILYSKKGVITRVSDALYTFHACRGQTL